MSDEAPGDTVGERAYRRGFRDKGNKREDWAIDVFREVFASLDDAGRVDRLLFDLGGYYNALADGPIVDLATRREVWRLLSAGRPHDARRLLRSWRDRYRGRIGVGVGA